MNTNNKFSHKFGKIELRAKLAEGKGFWNALWLLGDNIDKIGWPACGDIDIVEMAGKEPNVAYAKMQ